VGIGVTQEQVNNIRQGLGQYATEQRFVARQGKVPMNPLTGYRAKANDHTTFVVGIRVGWITSLRLYSSNIFEKLGKAEVLAHG
jgi:hypothetical protein